MEKRREARRRNYHLAVEHLGKEIHKEGKRTKRKKKQEKAQKILEEWRGVKQLDKMKYRDKKGQITAIAVNLSMLEVPMTAINLSMSIQVE